MEIAFTLIRFARHSNCFYVRFGKDCLWALCMCFLSRHTSTSIGRQSSGFFSTRSLSFIWGRLGVIWERNLSCSQQWTLSNEKQTSVTHSHRRLLFGQGCLALSADLLRLSTHRRFCVCECKLYEN